MSYAPPYKSFNADGIQVAFPFEFELEKEGDMKVYYTEEGKEANEVLDLVDSSEYSVIIATLPTLGGTVTFITAPLSGGHLVLRRTMVLENPTSFKDVNTFDGEALDKALSRLLLMVQENNFDASDRALHYPVNAENLSLQETEVPILEEGEMWKKVGGNIIDVTPIDGDSTLRSELANETAGSDGASLVGYNQTGAASPQTTVNAVLDGIFDGSDPLLVKAIVDISHPIGIVILDTSGVLTPPGQGIAGIVWSEETSANGRILMGHSASGDWAVEVGSASGSITVTDPMTLSNLIEHNHEIGPLSPTVGLLDETGGTGISFNSGTSGKISVNSVQNTGSSSPSGISLTGLKRFGVKLWKRTA